MYINGMGSLLYAPTQALKVCSRICAWESAHHGVMEFFVAMGSDTRALGFMVHVTRGLIPFK